MTAFLWALLTAGIWGIVPLIEKVGLGNAVSPTVGVVVRSVGVLIGLVLVSLFTSPWAALRTLPLSSYLLLAGGGLLASFVGQWAFYHALRSGVVSQVTPVAGAYPLISALLGWWLLREPLNGSRVLGVLLIMSGLWFLRK